MKNKKQYKIYFTAACTFLVFTSLSAATLYVRSPAAKLLNLPKMNAGGTPLKKGQALTRIGQQGMFYHVRAGGGTGYVSKLFVSNIKPGKKVSFGTNVNKNTSVKARARASNYSQTASARGFSSSESLRARGSLHEFDFDSVQWLERLNVDETELEAFQNAAP